MYKDIFWDGFYCIKNVRKILYFFEGIGKTNSLFIIYGVENRGYTNFGIMVWKSAEALSLRACRPLGFLTPSPSSPFQGGVYPSPSPPRWGALGHLFVPRNPPPHFLGPKMAPKTP